MLRRSIYSIGVNRLPTSPCLNGDMIFYHLIIKQVNGVISGLAFGVTILLCAHGYILCTSILSAYRVAVWEQR